MEDEIRPPLKVPKLLSVELVFSTFPWSLCIGFGLGFSIGKNSQISFK